MRLFKLFVIVLVSCVLNAPPALAQSIDLPSLGDAGSEELSPVTERKLGEQIMFEVRRDLANTGEHEAYAFWDGQFIVRYTVVGG